MNERYIEFNAYFNGKHISNYNIIKIYFNFIINYNRYKGVIKRVSE